MPVRRRSFMSRDNISHAWPYGARSAAAFAVHIKLRLTTVKTSIWLNTMKKESHYVSLFHSSQIYYACPMDLLVTWGSNLTKSSPHHSLANFSQSGFLPATRRLWTSEHPFFPKRTGFWCHLTFNNVVKMISNLTLPIVGESVIGWGIVSSFIPPPYPHLILYSTRDKSYIYLSLQ